MRTELSSSDDGTGREEFRLYVSAILRSRYWRTRIRLGFQALVLGVVAGMAVFAAVNSGLLPSYADQWWPLSIILVTGAFARLLVPSLRSSFSVLIGAFFVGLAVHVVAWILPLWLLPYPVIIRDVLLPGYVGRALFSAIFLYPTVFIVGYLVGLLLDAYVYT